MKKGLASIHKIIIILLESKCWGTKHTALAFNDEKIYSFTPKE
jgi:hypothetical protein